MRMASGAGHGESKCEVMISFSEPLAIWDSV